MFAQDLSKNSIKKKYHVPCKVRKSQGLELCSMKNFHSWLKHFELFSESFKGDWIFYDISHILGAIWLPGTRIKGNVCFTACIPNLGNKKDTLKSCNTYLQSVEPRLKGHYHAADQRNFHFLISTLYFPKATKYTNKFVKEIPQNKIEQVFWGRTTGL